MATSTTTAGKIKSPAKIETLEIIPLDALGSDNSYQRFLSMNYVQQLVERWDPRACGPLLVSRRKNGAMFVVDGQHRLEAMKMRGDTECMALVRNDLNEAEEAKIRLATQFVKPERAWERFKAALAAKDPEAQAILKLVQSCGANLVLERTIPSVEEGKDNFIRSVRAVENIYRLDKGITLTSLLNLIVEVHGSINSYNARANYLRSLAWLLFTHPEIDRKNLVEVLKREWTALETRGRASANPFTVQAVLWTLMYREALSSYNRATKSKIQPSTKGVTRFVSWTGTLAFPKAMGDLKRAGAPKNTKNTKGTNTK